MEHLFDTHFHLDLQKNKADVIKEIEEKGIYTIAVTNLPDLYRKESVEVASKYIHFGLGFHPELIHQYANQIPLMWDLLPETRYIGEVGLDFVDTSFRNEQVRFFSDLIERCRYDRDKVLSIHSRRAVRQVLDIIGDNYRFKPILHWFSGNKRELLDAVSTGFYFSVNGAMMVSKRLLDLLPMIPKERLLLETDSPFTSFNGSHFDTLRRIEQELRLHVPDVDVWNNFRRVLSI